MQNRIHFFQGLVFALLISTSSFSQEVFLGPKLGLSIHKASFNYPEDEEIFDQKIQLGYQIGGAFELPLENIFSFYSELYFTQKGKKTIIVENGLVNTSKYYFLEAPIHLRVKFEGGSSVAGPLKYHFDIGPKISYWMGGKGSVGIEGFKKYKVVFNNDTSQVATGDKLLISGANRLQRGLNVGAGLEYPVKKKQTVFIDIRFLFGHSNLVEAEGESDFDIFGYDDDLNVHFNQLVITAAYMFSYDWRKGLKGKSTIKKRKQF